MLPGLAILLQINCCNATPVTMLNPADVKTKQVHHMTINAPARDGNIAIREEFDRAMAEKSDDALLLFQERHPDHELAQLAADEIERRKN